MQKFAIFYLIAIIFFTWGIFAGHKHIFPWSFLEETYDEISAFFRGDEHEETTAITKVSSLKDPLARVRVGKLYFSTNEDEYDELNHATFKTDFLPPLVKKTTIGDKNPPLAIALNARAEGNKSLLAIFDEKRNLHRTINFDLDSFSKEFLSISGLPPSIVGFLNDGSVIGFVNQGSGLFRMDKCGKIKWSVPGFYHHTGDVDEDNIYLFGIPKNDIDRSFHKKWNHAEILNVVSLENGKIDRIVSLIDIMKRNLDSFDPLIQETADRLVNPDQMNTLDEDLWHFNTISVLSEELASDYSNFSSGDWLMHAKRLNLTLIIEPETLKIKWFSAGMTQGAHTPQWIGNGQIMLFNNRSDKNHPQKNHPNNYTNVMIYDFNTDKWAEHFNAKTINGFTRHSGGLGFGKNGNILLQFHLQGRVAEINNKGELVWEFVNRIGKRMALRMGNAYYIPEKAFREIKDAKCF